MCTMQSEGISLTKECFVSSSVDNAIKVLNEALQLHPEAINALFNTHVSVNDALANHPTIQVREGNYLSVIGILNGIFGADEEKNGFLAKSVDTDTERIVAFQRYIKPSDA